MPSTSVKTTRRLFFSLWPDDQVRSRLAHERLALAKEGAGRAMREDTLHLTLLFLGETPIARLDEVMACGDAISVAPFDLKVDSAAYFPKLKIAYLGMAESPPALLDLQSDLRVRVASARFGFYDREFHPHITAARNCQVIRSSRPVEPIEWHVDRFVLIDSDLNPPAPLRGPVYTVLKSWLLRA